PWLPPGPAPPGCRPPGGRLIASRGDGEASFPEGDSREELELRASDGSPPRIPVGPDRSTAPSARPAPGPRPAARRGTRPGRPRAPADVRRAESYPRLGILPPQRARGLALLPLERLGRFCAVPERGGASFGHHVRAPLCAVYPGPTGAGGRGGFP